MALAICIGIGDRSPSKKAAPYRVPDVLRRTISNRMGKRRLKAVLMRAPALAQSTLCALCLTTGTKRGPRRCGSSGH